MNKNLTIIYYTANKISNYFFENTKKQLLKAINGLPIISVSQKPINLGKNICVGNIGQSIVNIYKQALIGAKKAKTKYIAMAEDDVLYSSEHFNYIPKKDIFAYDKNIWGIYTWVQPPIFSYKGRKNLSMLICERDLFIKAMEERFVKYPNEEKIPLELFGEPGKYERQMGVTVNKWEFYEAKKSSIIFSHSEAVGYKYLGKRKKLGDKRTDRLPFWGEAKNVLKLYTNE